MKWTRKTLGQENQKGMAIMIAVFTVVIIMYLVTEITYDSNVEYVVNANSVSRLKAFYAAKSGMDISLLRIKIFTKIQKQFGQSASPSQKKLLDMIWNFPFTWPPMVPPEASGVDKDMIKDKVKESKMDSTYYATIIDEGSKFDINDLASSSKGLRELSKKLLLQIFENRLRNDEDWAKKNRDLKYQEVINNIIDWEDDDQQAINGGDEKQAYADLQSEDLPPNRAFRTIEELRMVAGMTDEIYGMLRDRVTVYGMHAINPNYANAEVLKALDVSMTEAVVNKVVARRNDEKLGGPFKDDSDFWSFVNAEGGRVSEENQKSLVLSFSQVINFRIKSVGEFANVTREIEAVVFDFSSVAATLASQTLQDAADAKNTGGGPKAKENTNNSNDPLPKGPPRIVYFIER